jgi:hypothetical protein
VRWLEASTYHVYEGTHIIRDPPNGDGKWNGSDKWNGRDKWGDHVRNDWNNNWWNKHGHGDRRHAAIAGGKGTSY